MKNSELLLVTGGSGFIGTHIIEWAINNSYSVVNYDINPPKVNAHKLYWVKVDINDLKSMKNDIKKINPTYIIHLAAALGMDHKNLDSLETNIRGVENIIKIANSLKDIKRVLFTSSLLVCPLGYIPKEDADYNPPNFYGKSKVIGEKKVRFSDASFEWAIVRPTSIWGPWFDYSYKTFFKMIDQNKYVHIGKNEFQKPASFAGNTVHMMMKILLNNNPKINKSIFYLADYPWYSTRKWANTIQNILNSKKIKTAPLWFLRIIAYTGDIIKKIFKIDLPLTSFRLNNMLTGGAYPVVNTKDVVGELPFDLNESVYLTAKWMYDNNMIKHKPEKL